MTISQIIKDIFTIFHDGCIVDYDAIDKDLKLKIEINYLAELIDSNFNFIYLTLLKIEKFHFEPWDDSMNVIKEFETIFNKELCIVSTEIDSNNNVIVHCNILNNGTKELGGGKLIIDVEDFRLTDEGGKHLTINNLKNISQRYWNDIFPTKK